MPPTVPRAARLDVDGRFPATTFRRTRSDQSALPANPFTISRHLAYKGGMTDSLTVKQMAQILSGSRDSEQYRRVYRQIRYWTEKDALPPDSDIEPGTGTSLEYSQDKVYHAALLQELGNIGVNQMALARLADYLEDSYENGYWELAKSGNSDIYLTGLFNRYGEVKWELSEGMPLTAYLEKNTSNKKLNEPGNPFVYSSAIAVNLTTVFGRVSFG